MYRVVLIDDENIIVEGLRRVVRWADYNCQVVGTACDAEAGTRLIRELQPHILFTDIRMPGRDGLAMVERLDKNPIHEDEEEQSRNAGSFIVNQALGFMEKHYAEKLTLQAVADCCYVSQWHLSKLLNKYAEKSFYDILNAIRIQKAKELLADPKLKIGQIGELVGYADTAHFARTFRKLEGMSANEYRNTIR